MTAATTPKQPLWPTISLQMPEYNRFTKGIYGWVGFQTKWIEYENVERAKGETKWNFWKLLLYSLEGITASKQEGFEKLYIKYMNLERN